MQELRKGAEIVTYKEISWLSKNCLNFIAIFFVLMPIFLPGPGNSCSKTIPTQLLLNVQAYETLAKLESRNDSNEILGKYVDYHFEASEYEKKLIQV